MNAPFPSPEADGLIKIAVLAVGGQGGGVLTDWITEVAERSGYVAQATSVAGVAQRTGATIYYIEVCPVSSRQPVFALSPGQGDIDILIAAELMEAGRAILRGFVTPDRTTLIASSHRILAVAEKVVPGDGRGSAEKVFEAASASAKRVVAFDMEKIAAEAGTFISASLLGALAGSGALPFPRTSYESVLAAGRGATGNLAAFGKAFERAANPGSLAAEVPAAVAAPETDIRGQGRMVADWQALLQLLQTLPAEVRDIAGRGLRKVVDYQDFAYGREYLGLLDLAVKMDRGEHGHAFSNAAAKHLANAMCYDDIIRVADLKTRSSRDMRVRRDVGVDDGAVLKVTEYFHPRIEEFCGTLPVRLGRYIESRPGLSRWLDRRLNRGRHVRTDSVAGFATLWLIAGLRRFRRKLMRHEVEAKHLAGWYELALSTYARDPQLATEILQCRRLIKGYSDTHARGLSKFDRVLSALPMLEGRDDAADWLRRLREAALKDEAGTALDGALKTVASFAR